MGQKKRTYRKGEDCKNEREKLIACAYALNGHDRRLNKHRKEIVCNMNSDRGGYGFRCKKHDTKHHAREKSWQNLIKAKAEK